MKEGAGDDGETGGRDGGAWASIASLGESAREKSTLKFSASHSINKRTANKHSIVS